VYIACPYCTQEIKIAMHYSGRNGLIRKLRSEHSRMHLAFRMLALPSIRTTIVIYGQYNANRKFTSDSKLAKRFVSEHKYIKKFLRQNCLASFSSQLSSRSSWRHFYMSFHIRDFFQQEIITWEFYHRAEKIFWIVWNFDEIRSLWIKRQVW